jgi:hypothetical protein
VTRAILLFSVSIFLMACKGPTGSSGSAGAAGPQGPAAPASVVDPAISAVVDSFYENINPGIDCNLQQVTGGQWISSSSPGYNSSQGVLVLGSSHSYTNFAGFNQSSVSSGPASEVSSDLQYLLVDWINYKLSCTGFVVLTEAGYYDFTLASDDGAILSISATTGLSGSFSINNDGEHGITTKSTTQGTYLYPGVYNFSLQYAQSGGGAFALIVSQTVNGVTSVVPAANLYH